MRILPAIVSAVLSGQALAQVEISRADYERRLRGMWLGQCLANWTGLQTEGVRIAPPFFTDADWAPPIGTGTLNFVTTLDPWPADDDTDIEYVYLHLLTQSGTPSLTPAQITAGWIAHINDFIWVSNAEARRLMGQFGIGPPITGMLHANPFGLMIDAQLTTEVFGALAPAMPGAALDLADLPIRTTASGHAAHASQFLVVLHALATRVPSALTPKEQGLWLVDHAREFLPASSKAADIVDFVRADYLANPDPDNWELTRDRIAQRYQLAAAANGFTYRAWYESSVNFATAVMILLYSEGSYRKAVRMGTLSGWDSDNPTATIGGLYGLMLGEDGVRAEFPGVTLSSRFWIRRTRPTMPDYLPADPQAEDTLALLAARMAAIVDTVVVEAGGTVNQAAGVWVVPIETGSPLQRNPMERDRARSANNASAGAIFETNGTFQGQPGGQALLLVNGLEFDGSGREPLSNAEASAVIEAPPGQELRAAVRYDRAMPIAGLRLAKGRDETLASGITQVRAEVWQDGAWTPAAGATVVWPLVVGQPSQVIEISWPMVWSTGVRVVLDGPQPVRASLAEVDAVLAMSALACPANCDGSSALPVLTPADFVCFLGKFRAGDPYANCDGSTAVPTLTPADFVCFLSAFRAGCPQ